MFVTNHTLEVLKQGTHQQSRLISGWIDNEAFDSQSDFGQGKFRSWKMRSCLVEPGRSAEPTSMDLRRSLAPSTPAGRQRIRAITPMLFTFLLGAQIGTALGDEQSLHSAELPGLAEHASCKGFAALRLENVRLRYRLAKTERALEAVSHKADACAAEAQQCSELRRAFADLESVNKELRQANARLRQKGGIECSLHFPHR